MYDTWVYRWWYKRRLRKYSDHPFKVRNETTALKTAVIVNIVRVAERNLKKAEEVLNKINTRQKKEKMFETYKDQFGNERKIKLPIFKQNEVEEARSIIRRFFAAILLFVLFESALWYFVADLFIAEGVVFLKILMAFFLGLIFMKVLERAADYWSDYRLAEIEKEGNRISEAKFKKYKDGKVYAYLLMSFVIIAIIFAGVSRLIFLEGFDPQIYGAKEAEKLDTAYLLASIFLIILNLATAFYLASISQKYYEIKIRYKTYKSWRRHNKQFKNHISYLRELVLNLNNRIKYYIERFWQLIIEMKRIYATECDDDKKDLYKEFLELKKIPNFKINDDIYNKFEDIQAVDKGLWEYGINKDSQVVEIHTKIQIYLTKIDELKAITTSNDIEPKENDDAKN